MSVLEVLYFFYHLPIGRLVTKLKSPLKLLSIHKYIVCKISVECPFKSVNSGLDLNLLGYYWINMTISFLLGLCLRRVLLPLEMDQLSIENP